MKLGIGLVVLVLVHGCGGANTGADADGQAADRTEVGRDVTAEQMSPDAAPDGDGSGDDAPGADGAGSSDVTSDADAASDGADVGSDGSVDALPSAYVPVRMDAGGAGAASCIGCLVAPFPELWALRMLYDRKLRRLFVTVYGPSPANPNTVTIIDPEMARIEAGIPVGSDPSALAISDDSTTLWVGLVSAHAFRKVTLSTPPVVGPLHRLPPIGTSYYHPAELAPLPGAPASIAVIHGSGGFYGRATVFDDGVARPMVTQGVSGAVGFIRGPDSFFYGAGSSPSLLGLYLVSASGISGMSIAGPDLGRTLVYDSGRLYGSSGAVVDVSEPALPKSLGRFPSSGPISLRDSTRLLMVVPAPPGDAFGPPRVVTLHTGTFQEVSSVTLPREIFDFGTSVNAFTYAGGDAVAMIVSNSRAPRAYLVLFRSPELLR